MATPPQYLTFDAFFNDVKEPGTPLISPGRFAARLHVEQTYLASLAHVHRNTVSRAPQSPKLQGYLRAAVRVIAAATELKGNGDDALYWFRNRPLDIFDGKTAEVLVSEGRAGDVVNYIESLDAGAAG